MKARFLVVALTMATALMAQGPGGGFRRNSLTPPTPPTPAELIQRQVSSLTRYFGLTTSPVNQVAAVTTILTTEQSCLTSNSTNLQTARQNLVAAIKTGTPTIASAIDALGVLQAAQETCQATAAAGIYAILTPDQQAKVGTGLGPLMGGGARFGPPPSH